MNNSFLEVYKQLMHCLIVFPFFLKYLTNTECMISNFSIAKLVVYIIYISLYFLRLAKQYHFIPLQNVVYFITLPFWFVKYSHIT